MHQRPDHLGRRVFRHRCRPHRRAHPRRTTRRRRLELRGRERLGALLLRHDDQRARRVARVRASDRRIGRGGRGPPKRRGVPARAQPVPPQEHRRSRRSGLSRVRVPVLLALRRAACTRLLLPVGRAARSADGRGGGRRAIEAATRWPVAARPDPPRPCPLRHGGGVGRPSRFNTLRALRVLDWWDRAT